MSLITVELLQRLGIPRSTAAIWAQPLEQAAQRYGMNTPTVVEDWVAQLVHESEGFTKDRENLYYTTPERLVAVWETRFSMRRGTGKLYAPDYVRNPDKLANEVYANRMGNGSPASGDGSRFSGGGPGMLTGREMWQAYADYSGNDVVNNPSLFKDPVIGADSAAWMFAVAKGLVDEAKADLVKLITKRINGGYIGLNDRLRLTNIARQYFVEKGIRLDQPIYAQVAPLATPTPDIHPEMGWIKDDQGQDIVVIQPEQTPAQVSRPSVPKPPPPANVVDPPPPSNLKPARKPFLSGVAMRFVAPMIGGWIRHALTILGGYVVAKGYTDADTANEVIGILMSVIGVVWSSYEKSKKPSEPKPAAA